MLYFRKQFGGRWPPGGASVQASLAPDMEKQRMAAEVPPTPQRVLAVAAHPDDIEFMAGGTMAHWAAAGAESPT